MLVGRAVEVMEVKVPPPMVFMVNSKFAFVAWEELMRWLRRGNWYY
jgi:hypothetical protein